MRTTGDPEGLPAGPGQKAPGAADVPSELRSLGWSIPFQLILSAEGQPRMTSTKPNECPNPKPTSAQLQCDGINKEVLVKASSVTGNIGGKMSSVCSQITWEKVELLAE